MRAECSNLVQPNATAVLDNCRARVVVVHFSRRITFTGALQQGCKDRGAYGPDERIVNLPTDA